MNTLVELTGPTQEPASDGPAKQLLILCHGVGADGSDLLGIAPYLAKVLPDAKFMAPDAPHRFDLAPFGRQWFSLLDVTPETRLAGAQAAAPILDAFIDAQLAAHGLEDKDLALVGFSQGTMMALHVGLRRRRAPAAIVGYSGMLVGEDRLAAEMTCRPPVLLVHGDTDDVVPPDALPAAVAALEGAGLRVRHELRPGLGHGLDDRAIILAMDFLAESFGVPLPRLDPEPPGGV